MNEQVKESQQAKIMFYPVTPGGTVLVHLARDTEETAIEALLKDTAHMPYGSWENFKKRGYKLTRNVSVMWGPHP